MSNFAIQVEGLGKEYVIGAAEQRHDSFREMLTGSLTAPLRRLRKLGGTAGEEERFWALKDVSFNVEQGEVLGVIGRNGAGKSTLLKILSRITSPSKGRVVTRGRIASLLEVGTGFHPELTGRENVYLNGAILGMSRLEIGKRFDEIVAFAEVERFLDTPVKRYSSGMYVRLAFAVAAHMNPEILLVDEVLAVGDVQFQQRCLGRMGRVAGEGRTILFVSHNLAAVRELCSRILVLEDGAVAFDGVASEALSRYEAQSYHSAGLIAQADFQGSLANVLTFQKLVCAQRGDNVVAIDPLERLQIEIEGFSGKSFNNLELKLAFFRDGFFIGACHDTPSAAAMREGKFVVRFNFPGGVFRPGRYALGIGASAIMGEWTWGNDVAVLDFTENRGGLSQGRSDGVIAIPHCAERIQ